MPFCNEKSVSNFIKDYFTIFKIIINNFDINIIYHKIVSFKNVIELIMSNLILICKKSKEYNKI